MIGIEALDRLNETEVSLLNQVENVRPVSPIFHRDLHDQTKIREDELSTRFGIAALHPPNG